MTKYRQHISKYKPKTTAVFFIFLNIFTYSNKSPAKLTVLSPVLNMLTHTLTQHDLLAHQLSKREMSSTVAHASKLNEHAKEKRHARQSARKLRVVCLSSRRPLRTIIRISNYFHSPTS